MSIRPKTKEEALSASYLFQKDIERALDIPMEQARMIFIRAKQIDREAGIVEISPRKVRRIAAEKASGIRFDKILREEKEKAAKDGQGDVGTSSKV